MRKIFNLKNFSFLFLKSKIQPINEIKSDNKKQPELITDRKF